MTRATKPKEPEPACTTEIVSFRCNGVTVNAKIKRLDDDGRLICPRCGKPCHELYPVAYELWCADCKGQLKQLSLLELL